MIPDEAVEAAAEYLTLLMSDPRGDYTAEAKALLKAAAPHLMAAAWDEGWQAGSSDETDSYNGPCAVTTPNPYRPDE